MCSSARAKEGVNNVGQNWGGEKEQEAEAFPKKGEKQDVGKREREKQEER